MRVLILSAALMVGCYASAEAQLPDDTLPGHSALGRAVCEPVDCSDASYTPEGVYWLLYLHLNSVGLAPTEWHVWLLRAMADELECWLRSP